MNSDEVSSVKDANSTPLRAVAWLGMLRMLFGALFIASAVLKLFPLEYFELILVDQVGASWKWVPWYSRLLVWFEFALGVALVAGFQTKRSAWLSLGLLVAFQGFLLMQILAGEGDADCGCFGELIPLNGPESMAKNFGLILIGGLLLGWTKAAKRWRFPYAAPVLAVIAIPALLLFRPLPDFDPDADFELDLELLQRTSFGLPSQLDEGEKTVVLMLASCIHCAQLSTLISQLDPAEVEEDLRIIMVGNPGAVAYFIEETGIQAFPIASTLDRELIGAIDGTFPTVLFLEEGEVKKKWKGRDVNISLLTDLLRLD